MSNNQEGFIYKGKMKTPDNDEVYMLRQKLETTAKELEITTGSKKRFKWFALGLLLMLMVIFALLYKMTVLDYAEIENVKMEQQGNTRWILFTFDVKTGGRLDYHYEKTVMVDRKKSGKDQNFSWAWGENKESEVSIRSRSSIFPKWHRQVFRFSD